ncbi:MAG: hypothetical protein Q7R40_06410 [Phaeospirillum sp.]|nr:hypothetical protein [Phaeospirillum sp.]
MLSSITDKGVEAYKSASMSQVNAAHEVDHFIQQAGAKLLISVVEQTHEIDIIKTLCNSTTAPENVVLAAGRAFKALERKRIEALASEVDAELRTDPFR